MYHDEADRGREANRLRQPRLGGATIVPDPEVVRRGARISGRTVAFGRTAGAAIPGQYDGGTDRAGARTDSAAGLSLSRR